MISFGDKQRELGESARQKKVTNFKNTVAYFKHFVGREWKDPEVQELLKRDAVETEEMPDGTIGFKVRAYGEKKVISHLEFLFLVFCHSDFHRLRVRVHVCTDHYRAHTAALVLTARTSAFVPNAQSNPPVHLITHPRRSLV